MPAPGDQHLNNNIQNPFEEVKSRISEYTAQEIATIQSRLERQLGPEYISTRPGPSGQKVHYITGEKCIQLANEVFGFNGWSSSIVNIQVDTVDENPTTRNISLGLSVIVRVTLRDGTYHEDVGYGDVSNCKGKAAAFNKAKKEATTDALKRALRNFGNVLGNCMYDKDYLSKVVKIKAAPPKWDVGDLYRHPDYVLALPVKKEMEATVADNVIKVVPPDLGKLSVDMGRLKRADRRVIATSDSLEDEFGDFDDDDFGLGHDPDFHPDGVLLPESAPSRQFDISPPVAVSDPREAAKARVQSRQMPPPDQVQTVPGFPKPVNDGAAGECGNAKHGQQTQQFNPQTHPSNTRLVRSNSEAYNGGHTRALPDLNNAARHLQTVNNGTGRVLNQPSRTGQLSAPHTPAQKQALSLVGREDSPENGQPAIQSGFFSARAATLLPAVPDSEGPPPMLPGNLPTFNPHAESPSIRRTPGIDHSATKPLGKDLKHVPGGTQTAAGANPAPLKTNVINPQLDVMRKIGAPGSPSLMANRGSYRPPTMKRPLQQPNLVRPPLEDVPTNGIMSGPDGGGDTKRPRLGGS